MARRHACVLACLVPLAIAGCGDSRSTFDGSAPRVDSGAPGPDGGAADASRPGPDGASADAGSDSDGGGPAPTTPFCVLSCATGADCVTPSPAFDLDNYRCEAGSCRYTGCVDDEECRATFASASYVCRDPGTGLRSCLLGCTAATECGSGTAAFDGDNYHCEAGLCIYQGCNSDLECESTLGGAYGCFDVEPPATPLPIPVADANCVRRCASAGDCATDSGAFGADNYMCEAGACRYRGCNDDVECRTSLSSPSYVCR